nr:ATP-binding cassette domain-containing protein [Cytophagales bacterium]
MLKLESWRTFLYFAKAYPFRGFLMVSSLVMAGFFEGIGVMALLPLVSILTDQSEQGDGLVSQSALAIFDFLSIDLSIGPILLFIVIAMILKACTTMFAMSQVVYASAHVCADLRNAYLSNLLKSSWWHFTNLQSGTSANAIGTEAQRAANCFMQACNAIAFAIQVVVYGALAFFLSWSLTLSAIIAGFIMVMLLSVLVRIARVAGDQQTKTLNAVLIHIVETLNNVKPLKAMGKSNNLLHIMEQDVDLLQKAEIRLDLARQALRIMSEPVMVFFVCVGIYVILTYGNFPIAELLFMSVLFLRMVTKVTAVQNAYLSMAANDSAFWSLLGKINAAKQVEDYFGGKEKVSLSRNIRLEDISFFYDNQAVFENISFDLPAKGFFVLFGPSGEGKTTLLDLIIGLHKPTSGTIYIDGVSLNNLDKQHWRAQIGYVPQEVLLFHDTVANNVTLNEKNVSPEEIERALKMAGAHHFVQGMEKGVETVVGERGSKISGGQRQRLAIARALLNHPSILILDEATSALDRDTEKEILRTVKGLSKTILVLLISHNPTAFEFADCIMRLENGNISEVPSEELKAIAG